MGRATVVAALTSAIACGAFGCSAGPRELDWALSFDAPADAARSRAIEVCIVEGACPDAPLRCDEGALVRYRDTFGYDDEEGVEVPEGAPRPPQLAPGRYAFVARARDAGCVVVATGCTEIDVPETSVSVALSTAAGASADCCGATCADGVCLSSDAGPACVDDGNPCTGVGCDASGACVTSPVENGTPCTGDGDLPCRAWSCMDGACVAAPIADGTACVGDGNTCREFACASGECVGAPIADGAACAGPSVACNQWVCAGGECGQSALTNGTPCVAPDVNPCLTPVCVNGTCVEFAWVANGTPCPDANPSDCLATSCQNGACTGTPRADADPCGAGRYRDRCCSGVCVDIHTDENHCGGCGLRCQAGTCLNRGDPRDTACTCAMGVDCPGGTTHFDCNAGGRCDCTSSMGCANGQSCRNVGSQPAFCVYP